jgi:hypothetical protein
MRCELPLKISPIKDMYRWVNLRGVRGGKETRLTDTKEPSNMPDSVTNDKHFVFVHGANVNEDESTAWASEVFKRLFWAGSKAKFTMVSWHGNVDALFGKIPNYWQDVTNAFMTSREFAAEIGKLKAPNDKIIVATHSLGNILVSSAIVDHKLVVDKYFMLNAAVPKEAYFEDEIDMTNSLVPNFQSAVSYWTTIDWARYAPDLWASNWYNLFPQGDDRRKLTWRNRFGNILNAYNFYSPGEEVLDNPSATRAIPEVELSWAYQEMHKGNLLLDRQLSLILPSQGGWGVNPIYGEEKKLITGIPIKYLEPWTPAQASGLLPETQKTVPFFKAFTEAGLTGIGGSSKAADYEIRAKALAEAIPALSFAAGRNPILGFEGRNKNMYEFRTAWPQERVSSKWESRWLHSDAKDVAYFFNHLLWKEWVTLGELNK